jgi:endogenous inhibitor of DNA gyrase (YacG/DUF329 family)
MSEPMKTVRTKPCPICGKPADARFGPFCTRRCADVDLHRWLSGSYVVPAQDTDEEESLPERREEEP